MLLNTATEEIGHIEMLATAVALNLENAPTTLQETAAEAHPIVNAVMGGERPRHVVEGMLQKHLLSSGMAAFPGNADGVPFDCSHIYASGNSRPTCSPTLRPRRPGGCSRFGSTTPPRTPA